MDTPHQWSVRAEFHITHPGLNDRKNPARTDTVQDDNGVKMSYSWDPTTDDVLASSSAKSDHPIYNSGETPLPGYTFQRGNISFSSTPPPRRGVSHVTPLQHPPHNLLQVPESSGYGSDLLLSPSSFGSSMRTKEQQDGRKCRSTCNIVLSANIHKLDHSRQHCGRTQSLRCQTPSVCCERRNDSFYGCGDPWCHHLRYGDDFSRRISPVREMCEDGKQEESEVGSTSIFSPDAHLKFFGPNSKLYGVTSSKDCEICAQRLRKNGESYAQTFNSEHNSPIRNSDSNRVNRDTKSCETDVTGNTEDNFIYEHSHIPFSSSTHISRPLLRTIDRGSSHIVPSPYNSDFRSIADAFKTCQHYEKKDVSVQTYNMVNKCTSPLLKSNDKFNESSKQVHKKGDKLKRGKTVASSRSSRSPSSSVASSNLKSLERALPKLNRSPSFKNTSTESYDKISPGSEGKSSDSSKKPRTIHIDVYCTGTEIESDSSNGSDSSRSKTASTPQTVFESDKVCVTHKKATPDKLPYILKQKLQAESTSNSTSLEKEDTDDESTAYPSKISSYSNMGCSLSSMSSFPNSMTSMSNTTFPELDTSWKDTFSDIGSLLNSRSSIGQTDSVYFVPKKIEEEIEEKENSPRPSDTCTSNSVSLQPSDSFEYANSDDRLRIKRMERLWKSKMNQKPHHRYPVLNRHMNEQQQSLQEAVNLRLSQMNESKDSDSDLSDENEKGWMFVKGDDKSVTSGDTAETQIEVTSSFNFVPHASNVDVTETFYTATKTSPESVNVSKTIFTTNHHSPRSPKKVERSDGSLSDSSIAPCKSPSLAIIQERLKCNPNLRSPFTLLPGQYTEPRMIAKKFGAVIEVFKKPGHHVGPAKNPSCLCDHCRRHFEDSIYRNRACSLDSERVRNWKELDDDENRRKTFTDI